MRRIKNGLLILPVLALMLCPLLAGAEVNGAYVDTPVFVASESDASQTEFEGERHESVPDDEQVAAAHGGPSDCSDAPEEGESAHPNQGNTDGGSKAYPESTPDLEPASELAPTPEREPSPLPEALDADQDANIEADQAAQIPVLPDMDQSTGTTAESEEEISDASDDDELMTPIEPVTPETTISGETLPQIEVIEEPEAVPEREVIVTCISGDVLRPDDAITLQAALVGFEGVNVQMQWQYDDGTGWRDAEGGTEAVYRVPASIEMLRSNWRVLIDVVE